MALYRGMLSVWCSIPALGEATDKLPLGFAELFNPPTSELHQN